MEEIILEKIPGKGSYKRTRVNPEQFKRLLKRGETKKSFNTKYKIGHRIWSLSIKESGLTELEVERMRRDKLISRGFRLGKVKRVKQRVQQISRVFPDLIKIYEKYKLSDPNRIHKEVIKIHDKIFELKKDLQALKKHYKRQVVNSGSKPGNFSSNSWEYKVKKILKDQGYKVRVQKRIGKYFFDLYLPEFKILVEVDSDQYHSKEIDKPKNKIAKKKGYKLIRITQKDIKYDTIIKDKINTALGVKNCL